jgi:multidrug efflux pump subunit AcrA (membrane-fusion protein)
METQSAGSAFQPTEATWHRIEELLAEIAIWSREVADRRAFYANVLRRLAEVIEAGGAVVWTVSTTHKLPVAASVEVDSYGLRDDERNCHRRFAELAMQTHGAQIILPGEGPADNAELINASGQVLLLQPILCAGQCVGVIELLGPGEWMEEARQFTLEVLGSVGELCADFERHRRLDDLGRKELESQQFDLLLRTLYGALDLQEASYHLANDGRQYVGCDRLTVLVRRGARMRTASVSGIAAADCRADVLRRLEKLSDSVADGGMPLVVSETEGKLPGELPEQVIEPLKDYLNSSPVRAVTVLPLRPDGELRPGGALAVLVVEHFAPPADRAVAHRLETLAPHATIVLRNALFVARIPFGRALFRRWSAIHQFVGKRRGILIGTAIAGVVGLCLIPAEFTVRARGELQPQHWREVFAPSDATVDELHVTENAAVGQGEPLLSLRDSELQLELKRVLGEIETSRERLVSIRTARIEGTTGSVASPVALSRLSGEEAEVTARLTSLERQLELLRKQEAELVVRSPFAGRVLTWDVEHLLRGRPVKRGQALLTVADTGGPWKIELHVPDKHAGHVQNARQSLGPELEIEYFLATDPVALYSSRIAEMALATEMDQHNEPAVRVTANVAPQDILQPRPRAAVVARIHCGRRPLLYVWLHDAIDSIRRLLLF